MTPRQLWLHFIALGVAGASLLALLIAAIFLAPQAGAAARHVAWAGLAWQSGLLLLLAGAALLNLRWGFPTAGPTWVLIIAAACTVWLIPLAVWTFCLWREERVYLETSSARRREAKRLRKKSDSAPKECPPP